MKKTLGGDRLGSGNNMKVDLHGYSRSTHDMGYLWRSTMAAGTLVPFLCEVALPGDTFDINLGMDIKTHPTIGPLFGSYKAQIDVFQAPIRLYNAHLHNNTLGIGMKMSQIKFPLIGYTVKPGSINADDPDNSQVNPACILSYLGLRGFGDPGASVVDHVRSFNAVPVLAYWEIYKNYYANKQEEIGAVLHTPAQALLENVVEIEATGGSTTITVPQNTAGEDILVTRFTQISVTVTTGDDIIPSQIIFSTSFGNVSFDDLCTGIVRTGDVYTGVYNAPKWGITQYLKYWRYQNSTDIGIGAPSIVTFPLSNIDDMRGDILTKTGFDPYVVNDNSIAPYKYLWEQPQGIPNVLSSQEGLGLKTYQSDLFNNWLKTEWIDGVDGITEITAIDTSGGSFTIDTLNLSKKVYDMLNRIAVSGGSYDDWLDAVYTHDRYQTSESPMYMGGLIKELVFQEVVSNSASATDVEQPLGTLAGKGVMAKKHKGGSVIVKVSEPSYIIGIVSLTPRLDYSQGNKWDVHLKTMDDLHKPALDEIGFQELITEQMAWWDTKYDGTKWLQKSAGKQPAWLNYMTNVNQVRGNFAIKENEMFMTLNRRYERGAGGIEDLTTYIDPSKYNFIFAETALDAQNFWTQIAVDMTVRRKMSARLMPNL